MVARVMRVFAHEWTHHSYTKNEFCKHWHERYGDSTITLRQASTQPIGAMGPSAMNYISFLRKKEILLEPFEQVPQPPIYLKGILQGPSYLLYCFSSVIRQEMRSNRYGGPCIKH